jgi:CRP-like cAMP-binding protein
MSDMAMLRQPRGNRLLSSISCPLLFADERMLCVTSPAMLPSAFNFISRVRHIGYEPKTVLLRKKQVIFSHGDQSDSIFYIEKGTVKLTITSRNGKEGLIAILDGEEFFGESCLSPEKPTRLHSATAMTNMQVLKVDRAVMISILRTNAEFAYSFITALLERNRKIQEHLVSGLLNSSTEQLAQVLSSLNRLRQSEEREPLPRLSQQDLANMVGITRQRANVLIKRLRKSASAGSERATRRA